MRRIVAISFASFVSVLCSPAVATCPPYRHTLNNGTTADAAQVMDNFNDVLNCMAPLANPVFTGKVAVGTTNVAALLTLFDPTTSLIRQGTQNYTYEVGPAADNGVFHIRRNDGLFADRLVIDVA